MFLSSYVDGGPMSPQPDPPIVRNTVEARGGVTGNNVRYVLVISLTAVIIAFAVVWFLFLR